ncbi:MAG: corrinoid protein [Clostridiales Family XIII bacterium]|jgi:5-methyltetrahydrofolate--homocysteine methyltransferase|nr:corrinoid protein [Clostridiales Family XIII bacterium]
MSDILATISEAIQDGDQAGTLDAVKSALGEGVAAQKILDDGLLKGMGIVGERFVAGDAFIPEVMMSANALNGATAILKEQFKAEGVTSAGKVVIATVKGDLHDIGKNLVKLMLEAGGFEVIDLGTDVPETDIIKTVKDNNADVIALSALLTTTMAEMRNVLAAIEAAGLKGKVKVLVGGAPITQTYADEIGADGTATNAASAAELAKQLVS